jgi:hypothetical protein
MSGGEGYIDFRFGQWRFSDGKQECHFFFLSFFPDDGDQTGEDERRQHTQQTPNRTDRSHLTVWQVPAAAFERS